MIWNAKNIDLLIEQKEYIDTALIPLIQIDGSQNGMKQSASSADFLMNLTAYIEKQFKGRIVQFPPFSYTTSANKSRLIEEWKEEFEKMTFKHIVYITTDSTWTSDEFIPDAIWIPSIPLEHMDTAIKQSVLQDQLRQIIPLLSKKWTSN